MYDPLSYYVLLQKWQESPQRDSNLGDAGAVLYQLSYQVNWELVVTWVSDKSVVKSSDRFYAKSDHLTPKMASVQVVETSVSNSSPSQDSSNLYRSLVIIFNQGMLLLGSKHFLIIHI